MRISKRAALAGAAFVWLAAGGAQAAPSFDCKAAGTPVEKAICADAGLSAADQELATAYRKLSALLDAAERDRLRAEQRAWLGQRNQCGANAACLNTALVARLTALNEALPAAVAGVARTVAGIATDPDGALRRLADVKEPLGKGWTAYLLRYSGPAPDRSKAAAVMREAVAGIDDEYARENAQGGDLATDEGFLTALRVVTDHYEMAWPCFLAQRHAKAVKVAQGPLYGSSRDGAGPMIDCPDDKGLLASAEWKVVDTMLDPMLGAAFARTGTLRSAVGRQMAVERLLSGVDPRVFVGQEPALGTVVAEIAGWTNPRWVGPDWGNRFRGAVEAAVQAWIPRLAPYGLSAPEARRVAEATAAASLSTSATFIKGHVTFDRDTRIPDWARGAWTWSGAAEFTPFAAPSGRAVIDAANVCVGKECEGFDVSEQGKDAMVEAQELKAAGVTAAPDAAKRAVELASAQTGAMFKLIPLADGGVLVGGSEKAAVLKRVK